METDIFWHSRSATAGMFTHMPSGRGRICHYLRTKIVWSAQFQSGHGKLGVGPICCGVDFAPTPPTFCDRVCMNACNDLCWSQFSNRLCPHPLRACVNVPLETNFSEISFKIQNFLFTKMHLKISSVKLRSFCPGGDELSCHNMFHLAHSQIIHGTMSRSRHKWPLHKVIDYK